VSTLLQAAEGGVVTLTINRPESRNALDAATYRALSAALLAADQDAAVRAVVVTGAAGHFTAGNDLRDFQNLSGDGEPAGLVYLKAIATFAKPLLAAVEGVAVGIGTTMLLHCDFAWAGEGARFRMPFVPLGLCAEGGSSLLLPRVAGQKRASDLLLTGREFAPAEALEAGLLTGTTPAGGALARAQEVARQVAALPPEAVRVTKALLRRPHQEQLLETLMVEIAEFATRLGSEEAQAAFAAFFAKRNR